MNTVQEFELFGRPALKKVKKDPNTKLLDAARNMYPNSYLIKYEIGTNNYAIVAFESLEDFWRRILNLNSELIRFHEIIGGVGDSLSEAYDIEFPITSHTDVNLFLENFVNYRNQYLTERAADWENVKPLVASDLIVFDSSDAVKFSLHIIAPFKYDCVFSLTEMKIWQAGFSSYLKERGASFDIDAAALSRKYGSFRTLHSRKLNSNRVMRVHQLGASRSPREYFVNAADDQGKCAMKRAIYLKGLAAKVELPPAIKIQAECVSADVDTFLRATFGADFTVEETGAGLWRLRRAATSQCLVNEAESHHDNHYCYLGKRGHLWIGCPHCPKKVKARKQVFFTPTFTAPPPEILKSATHFIDGQISESEYESILFDHDVVFDTRSTGCGKTYSALRYARAHFEKYLVLHHRISLDDDYSRAYGLPSYREGVSEGGTACSVVINSLDKTLNDRFGGNINNLEMIIVDEIRSVMRQTEMSDIERDVVTFLDMMKYSTAKKVLMDANITDADIEYLRALWPGARVAVIADKSRVADYKLNIVLSNSKSLYNNFTAALAGHDFSKCGVIVPYNIDSTKMDGVLNFIGQPYININRETRAELDLSAAALNKFPIIAFSPTISEGVSFDSELFSDRVGYACFIQSSCGPETASQMLRRFRQVRSYTAVIAANVERARFLDERGYLAFAGANVKVLNERVSRRYVYNHQKGHSDIEIIQDDFWLLHSRLAVEHEQHKCAFFDTFVQKCVNNKFDVELTDKCNLGTKDEIEMKRARSEAVTARYSRMEQLPDISNEQDYLNLKNECKTKDDSIRCEKWQIMKHGLIRRGRSDILEYFGTAPDMMRALNRLRELFDITVDRADNYKLHIKDAGAVIDDLEDTKLKAMQDKSNGHFIGQRAAILKMKPVIYSVILECLNALGFAGFFDMRALPNVDWARFLELFTYKKYSEMEVLAWRSPCAAQYDKLVNTTDRRKLIYYLNKFYFGHVGITMAEYKGSWRLFCLIGYVEPGYNGPVEHARLCGGMLEDIGTQLGGEFFCWDRKDICKQCGEPYFFLEQGVHLKFVCEGTAGKKAPVLYECKSCDKDFGNKKDHYERHLKSCGVVKEKKKHICKCGKDYDRKSKLDVHVLKCKE